MKNTVKNEKINLKFKILGFTLIELLAVIVILAIIAVIATPIIINIISDAKKESEKLSANAIIDAAENYYGSALLDENKKKDLNGLTDVLNKLSMSGKKPDNGNVYINSNGEIAMAVIYNKTCYKKEFIQDKLTENEKENGCELLTGTAIINYAKSLVYDSTNQCNADISYKYMGGCYIKGEKENNFVWYSGFLWRIMGINKDGSVKLITEEIVTSIEQNSNSNALDYENSTVRKWLNEYFLSNLKGTDIIVNNEFCRGTISTIVPSRTDCTGGLIVTDKVGMLSVDEISLSKITNKSYLFNLTNGFFTWTMSPYSNSKSWYVSSGSLYDYFVNNTRGIRPIINVNSNAIVTTGTGIKNDHFLLNQNDNNIKDKSIKQVSPSSGEYVKLGDKLYRIVSSNKMDVKLILDNYYADGYTVKFLPFGEKEVFTTASGIGKTLNEEVLNWLAPTDELKNKIKEGNWYQSKTGYSGSYQNSLDEENVLLPITKGKVGMIRLGEMLSAYSNSISNRNYWTLTRYYNTNYVIMGLNSAGSALTNSLDELLAIRPVINVDISLNISAGNGTLKSPYIL